MYCEYSFLAISTAFITLSTSWCLALPIVEWESIATYGSFPVSNLNDSALLDAIAASFSLSGFCSNPESAKINVPLEPYSQFGTTIKKNAETSFTCSFVFNICKAGLKVFDVEWQAPDTVPSALLVLTNIQA